MKRSALRELIRSRRGVSSVEFAIVSIVFLPICFGILELGFMMWVQNSLQTTAEETARCVATGNSACTDAQQFAVTTAAQWIPSGLITTGDVTVNTGASCNSSPGTAVVVTISHNFWGDTIVPPPFQSLATSVSSCFATGP